MLSRLYGKQVILLINEYDVPLDKAFQYGFYDEMVSLIRNLLGNALKTNSDLYFAVLTGCLRIAKKSIFTGLNNFRVLSITDARFDEYFGFTDTEVREMLKYYQLSEYYDTAKKWYDGYRFGNKEIYCPWEVINYCDHLRADPKACREVLAQIEEKQYDARLREDGMRNIIRYGIACYKKDCEVMIGTK